MHPAVLASWAAVAVVGMLWLAGRSPVHDHPADASNAAVMHMIRVQEELHASEKRLQRCTDGRRSRGHLEKLVRDQLRQGRTEVGKPQPPHVQKALDESLAAALRRRDRNEALLRVKAGAGNIVLPGEHRFTTAHLAAAVGSSSGVARGLRAGVADRWGWTPLHVAAGRGSIAAVAGFLGAGADVFALTADGWSPLLIANRSTSEGAREVELLISCSVAARLDAVVSTAGAPPQSLAALLTSRAVLFALPSLSLLSAPAARNAVRSLTLLPTHRGWVPPLPFASPFPSPLQLFLLFAALGPPHETRDQLLERAAAWEASIRQRGLR